MNWTRGKYNYYDPTIIPMGGWNLSDRIGAIAPYVLILLVSTVVRLYHLMNPLTFPGYSGTLSKNGADEGIFLMTSRLVDKGARMYVDVNTHQGPLFSLVFQVLNGDPLVIRSMTVIISLVGIAALIMTAHMSAGRRVAVVSSIFLSFNFVYFKVSRQASFDLYCTVLLTLAFLALVKYYQLIRDDPNGRWKVYLSLTAAGILFSTAAMSKLFAVVPILSVGVYMLVGWIRRRKIEGNGPLLHILVLVVFTALPALGMMFIYGFQETLSGMLLSNIGRPPVPLDRRAGVLFKFLVMASVPLILSLICMVRDRNDRTVQLMLLWLVPLFIFILFQSAIWDHYLMILLPPMCFLAGKGFDNLQRKLRSGKKVRAAIGRGEDGTKGAQRPHFGVAGVITVLSVAFIILSVVSITGLVMISDKEVEQQVADEVSSLTKSSDMIISGDPIIGVYAERLQPPEATNIAMVRSPPLMDNDLVNITCDHEVKVVVFTYNLVNYDLYLDFIRENYQFHRAYTWTGKISDVEGEIPIDLDTFNIYIRPDNLDLEEARERFFHG
ncbi:MAG: glycosyltransferase family 39 protein [Thermoplasmatota archaeon]